MLIIKIRVKVKKPTINYQMVQQTKQLSSVHLLLLQFFLGLEF